jgi:hypothetical protein
MENGISIFENWLESVGQMTAGRDRPAALDVVSSRAEAAFGTRIWFAQMLGRRWSYIAGLKSERPTWSDTAKIPLTAGIGLVAESWGELSLPEQDRLRAFLERLVVSRDSLVRWG